MMNWFFKALRVTIRASVFLSRLIASRIGPYVKRVPVAQLIPLMLLFPILLFLFTPDDIAEPVVNPVTETITETSFEAVTETTSIPPETEFVPIWTEEEVSYITKAVYGSAGTIPSLTEQSAVVWCILNWCDLENKSIIYEITYPNRFQGYHVNNPEPKYLRELVTDVLTRWQREKEGETSVGRTLPSNYYFFTGDGEHNHFRTEWESPYDTWDWSLPSPYES